MQLDLLESKSHETQTDKILKAISSNRGVTNYQLAGISLKYSSRISELRKDGHDIRAKRVYRGGKATGTYRYYLGEG